MNLNTHKLSGLSYCLLLFTMTTVAACHSDNTRDTNYYETPIAPSDFHVTFNQGHWSLNWSDKSENENGFHIWFSEKSPDSLKVVKETLAGATSDSIKGEYDPDRTYYWGITAYNIAGESARDTASLLLTPELAGINQIYVKSQNNTFVLYLNNQPFFIKGIGGTTRISEAKTSGANSFRTWDGNSLETVSKNLKIAADNGMYMMNGYWLSHNEADYKNEAYKEKSRKEVTLLAETFKNNKNLLIWCLGNELEMGVDKKEAWLFVEELAQLVKKIDPYHPVAMVISYNPSAAANVARYIPSIDILGVNAYGAVGAIDKLINNAGYKGAYMITEWGPNGTWEVGKTTWGAPIEQTSEEKRIVYEERYANAKKVNCLGSFVFLWGQKQETTPSWFGMFAEQGVDGLPLNAEAYPTVEAMTKCWSGTYPEKRAPIVRWMRLAGKTPGQSVTLQKNQEYPAQVEVYVHPGQTVQYVWEVLREATKLGVGGSYEPRPERIGQVITSSSNKQQIHVGAPGNYRLYVYTMSDCGFIGSANIPFKVE